MRRVIPAIAIVSTFALGSCDPCAGTPSCLATPMLSYSGQFIEHETGAAVAGVRVSFVRESGIPLSSDSISAVSDERGFFEVHALAPAEGEAVGRLIVTPPAPHAPYTVSDLRIRVSGRRGEGVYAGRLVVDPYMLVVLEARDRQNFAIAPGTQIRLAWRSGVRFSPDSVLVTTAFDGRTYVKLRAQGVGASNIMAITDAPGYPRTYQIPRQLQAQYIDRPAYDVTLLLLGPSIIYVGEVLRRGTRENLPGVSLEFRRTGGILVDPDVIVPGISPNGLFAITPEPLQDGELIGRLTVTPPAPYPVEVFSGLRLKSQDGDSAMFLGTFGYGAMLYLRSQLVRRADGAPMPQGTVGVMRRVGGVELEFVSPVDTGQRPVDSTGVLPWISATKDSGEVVVDIAVQIPGFPNDSIKGVRVRALYDTVSTVRGPFRVGPWYPQQGTLRDSTTNLPIANATVVFRRQSGASLPADSIVTQTDAGGRFRFTNVPVAPGAVVGTLSARHSSYVPRSIPGVELRATQADTLESLGTFRLVPVVP